MTIKEEAYKLHQSGRSYKEIATQLNISKTAAYEFVKELKFPSEKKERSLVLSSSERGLNVHSERSAGTTNPIEPIKIKEFTGDELVKMKFDCLNFKGQFLALIGRPSKLFSGMIWGLPKGGKSNLAVRFADYLQEYFGKVVYVAAEEGKGTTLQEKFKEIGGSKVTIITTCDRDSIRAYLNNKACDFVFIDSINKASIDNTFLELLKAENPTKSFVTIVQATKGGNFKGDQALTHNCDFIIKVVAGVAYHTGRFQTASEINIFEAPLYEKNPRPREVITQPVKEKQAEPKAAASLKGVPEKQQDTLPTAENILGDEEDNLDSDITPDSQPISFILSPALKKSIAAYLAKPSSPKDLRVAKPTPAVHQQPPLLHKQSATAGKVLLWLTGAAFAYSLLFNHKRQEEQQREETPL